MKILNKIYNEDCMKGMKQFPDKYFDAIVTDPQEIYPEWIKEAQRISRRMFVILGYWDLQKYLKIIDDYRDFIILYSDQKLQRNFVTVILSGDVQKLKPNLISFNLDPVELKKILHPCPIPLDAMSKLIKEYIKPGEKVCDPFMGSGTTAIPCSTLGIDWVGFEIQEGYYHTAKNRIESLKVFYKEKPL